MVPLENRGFISKMAEFRRLLVCWASSHTRAYPWRSHNRSAYDLLVAEILLKRTTAASAARTYESFLRRYPNLQGLINTTESQLVEAFSPVGLHYQRASAVAKMARYLGEHHAGMLPCSLESLLRIPGLGHYSARAILSFGYGVPAAIVDGNVTRVLGRVFRTILPERVNQSLLQAFADRLLPNHLHREYNFAILDLGALVCRPSHPQCHACPLTSLCDYYHSNLPSRDRSSSRVRELRIERRMSLTGLALASGVSKMTIINIEAGRTSPRPDTIMKLAGALETKPDALN